MELSGAALGRVAEETRARVEGALGPRLNALADATRARVEAALGPRVDALAERMRGLEALGTPKLEIPPEIAGAVSGFKDLARDLKEEMRNIVKSYMDLAMKVGELAGKQAAASPAPHPQAGYPPRYIASDFTVAMSPMEHRRAVGLRK